MYYIIDYQFNWYGVIDFVSSGEINHHYLNTDDLTLTIPYSKEMANTLKLGYILNKRGSKKGFIIETLEIRKESGEIWIYALGLESLFKRRICKYGRSLEGNVIEQLSWLVDLNFFTYENDTRGIPNFYNSSSHITLNQSINLLIEDGTTIYDFTNSMAKLFDFGFTIELDIDNNKMTFQTFLPKREYAPSVKWIDRWGHIYDETLLLSNKEKINVLYGMPDGAGASLRKSGNATGWNRFEGFIKYTDLKDDANLDQGQYDLLYMKVDNRLSKDINTHNKQITDLSFKLNSEVTDKYGTDFKEGDKVSLFHQEYNIKQDEIIYTVKEIITDNETTFEIIFDYQEE